MARQSAFGFIWPLANNKIQTCLSRQTDIRPRQIGLVVSSFEGNLPLFKHFVKFTKVQSVLCNFNFLSIYIRSEKPSGITLKSNCFQKKFWPANSRPSASNFKSVFSWSLFSENNFENKITFAILSQKKLKLSMELLNRQCTNDIMKLFFEV